MKNLKHNMPRKRKSLKRRRLFPPKNAVKRDRKNKVDQNHLGWYIIKIKLKNWLDVEAEEIEDSQ